MIAQWTTGTRPHPLLLLLLTTRVIFGEEEPAPVEDTITTITTVCCLQHSPQSAPFNEKGAHSVVHCQGNRHHYRHYHQSK